MGVEKGDKKGRTEDEAEEGEHRKTSLGTTSQ